MKSSKIISFLCLAAILVSCDKVDTDVYEYDPENFVWQEQTFTPYHYYQDVGPSTDMIPTELMRFHGSPYLADSFSWAAVGSSLASGAVSGLGSFLAGQLLSTVFTDLMKSDQQEIMNALDGISSELNNLKSLAYDILDKLDEIEMNELLSKFDAINSKLTLFDAFNRTYFEKVELAIKNGASEDFLKEMLIEWGNTTIGGWPASVCAMEVASDVLNFRFQYHGVNLNYCMVIDLLAFDMFPWESIGYDFRDMYRGETAAKIVRCLYLAGAYYYAQGLFNSVERVKSYAMSLQEYFDKCTVERHENVAVCQIKDAHFTLAKDALVQRKGFYFTEKPRTDNWWRDSKCMGEKSSVPLEGKITSVQDDYATNRYLSSQFTNKEIQAIIKYYSATHPYDYTLLDCLAEGGVTIPDDFIGTYSMSSETPGLVLSFDRIYLGLSESRFYLRADKIVNREKDEIHLGISNFYIVGIPICGKANNGLISADSSNYSIDSSTHTRFPDLILNTEQYSYKIGNDYYYDQWAFYNVLKFDYPDIFLMLKEGSITRY